MGILSYTELVQLIEDGTIDAPIENVNGSSIDITLGTGFLVEKESHHYSDFELIRFDGKTNWLEPYHDLEEVLLEPNEFVLAVAKEKLNLPLDISAQYMLKSSLARDGLGHQLAGWIDAGYCGNITLEFKNDTKRHDMVLRSGMKCGQLIFHRHTPVPLDKSYKARGQYMNNTSVTPSKGVK